MIINKGGCGKTSPGIGDVQFVKDLMTDNIVTTNFRCSKFGISHNPRTKFGWVCISSLVPIVLMQALNVTRHLV